MIVSLPRHLLALLFGLLLSLPGAAQRLPLRLLLTTDVHMQLLDHDYTLDRPSPQFGLARTASLIEQARAEAPNHLLFDNGDLLQGSPLGDWLAHQGNWPPAQLHPAYRVLRALQVDAANLGNHEFDFGLPFLRRALQGVPFPVLSANLLDSRSGKPAFKPAVMLERRWRDEQGRVHRLRVGVIGLAPPRSVALLREQLLGRLRTQDAVTSARHWVRQLRRQGADLVLLLAHTGLEPAGQTARPLDDNVALALAELPGVDALLLGHAHGLFPSPAYAQHPGVDVEHGRIGKVPAVMAGRWGDHLGLIDLLLERRHGRWQVRESRSVLRPVWDAQQQRARAEPATWVAPLIQQEHEATRAWVQQPVAQSRVPLHTHFAQLLDSAALQLLNEAQLAQLDRELKGSRWEALPRLSAASPFKTTSLHGQAADIPVGPLALKHAVDLYPYQNRFKALKVNGAQLRDWLEMVAGQFRTIDPAGPAEQELLDPDYPSYNFDVIDGVRYAFDLTQRPRYTSYGQRRPDGGQRVALLEYQGQPVRPEQEFVVATNSYRAEGGGRFAALQGAEVVAEGRADSRQVLLDHMRQLGTVSTVPDQNWWIQPVPGTRLVFRGLAEAARHLEQTPGVNTLGQPEAGLQRFSLGGR
ncbi:bifunctional 2',3'-cyclic-nucleotide 2'-phosphodiesterase/3'-nucleotidase [Inhella proteolytica]|uniref:Bifunctional 2',3'-cyclic-nucleotide 2'-phosphodiesterase/3'-nucleotidase n=1 Tax=Inhella proteolytica TaxID=2795029 RepID=A0A931J1D5_9BURK|nr:bifunctional 2',3'-cyclic-nucleotide 2'-phosphodiesterase/3'-nucleotidase [Inhella proteolytica]MBH9575744.1 bifunctional 2',3'-cyclic-nucleotide 2'-phosphodiesterase/3'-nucleotidase [Inhella proteolytica]